MTSTFSLPKTILGFDLSSEEDIKKLGYYIAENYYVKRKSPKEIFNLSDEDLEECYSVSYYLYTNGKYEEAKVLLQQIVLMSPTSFKYAFALAICLHQLEQYPIAAKTYSLAYLNDPLNPTPLYYAAECCMAMNRNDLAKDYLEQVIQIGSDRGVFSQLKQKSTMLLEGFKKNPPKESP